MSALLPAQRSSFVARVLMPAVLAVLGFIGTMIQAAVIIVGLFLAGFGLAAILDPQPAHGIVLPLPVVPAAPSPPSCVTIDPDFETTIPPSQKQDSVIEAVTRSRVVATAQP